MYLELLIIIHKVKDFPLALDSWLVYCLKGSLHHHMTKEIDAV